jgi:hypothetical protein
MPKPATVAQRLAWHLAHAKHCGWLVSLRALAEVYLVRPKGAPRGGVLVLHAVWGLNPFVRRV